MDDVYRRLSRHLDHLPAGFPPTDSGVELRILKRLFTPHEAETALGLTMMPEPVDAIADRLKADPANLAETLAAMSRKGLIFRMAKNGTTLYMAAQFVIGIWEYHVNDLDADLIRDFNEYVPVLMKQTWERTQTKQLRVVPVAQSIAAQTAVMPYDAVETIVRKQKKIVVAPCICRKEHAMVGKGCGKPLETCLVFGGGAYFYEENGLGRSISQAEALDLLQNAAAAGLVLQAGNSQRPMNICMCCGDCCQILKNLNLLTAPAQVVSANFRAEVDPTACTACEACADRCQMAAIEVGETARILPERCIGCGLCVAACEFDALRLVEKAPEAAPAPPAHTIETYMNMARERGLL
jgi:ferredoxin